MKHIIFLSATIIFLSACGGKKKTAEATVVTSNANVITLTDVQIKNAAIVTGKMEQKEITIRLINTNGKLVLEKHFEMPLDLISIPIGQLPVGLYLLRIELMGKVQTLKIIKSE